MKIKELLIAIGIFLLVILIMLIIIVGIVLTAQFVPILAWIIFGVALVSLFIVIYIQVRSY